ncbi:MAG: potassium channel family protein [Candidatus Woesearchaeota archaeon]
MGYITKSTLQLRIAMVTAVVMLLLLVGTIFFHYTEDWSWIDALYYSAISLSTRGYSDLHPQTVAGKLFTIVYLFIGVAFIVYMFSSFVAYYMEFHEPKIKKRIEGAVKQFRKEPERWVVIKTPKPSTKTDVSWHKAYFQKSSKEHAQEKEVAQQPDNLR